MTTLTEDIEAQTASYLSALKSNSDEIARLAEALRAAEVERDNALNERAAAWQDVHIYKLASEIMRAERDAARADAERLATVMNVIAYEPIGDSEASFRTVYESITEMARAAHRATQKVTP